MAPAARLLGVPHIHSHFISLTYTHAHTHSSVQISWQKTVPGTVTLSKESGDVKEVGIKIQIK